jgi:hypothetical protein
MYANYSFPFVHLFKNCNTNGKQTGHKTCFIVHHHFCSTNFILINKCLLSHIQDMHTSTHWSLYKLWFISAKSGMCWQILIKHSNAKFHKNTFSSYWIPVFIQNDSHSEANRYTFATFHCEHIKNIKCTDFLRWQCTKTDHRNCKI